MIKKTTKRPKHALLPYIDNLHILYHNSSQYVDILSNHNLSNHFRGFTKMVIEYQKEACVILCTKVPEPAIFQRFLTLQLCIINYISTFLAFFHVPLPYILQKPMCFNNTCISSSEPQNQM